MIPRFFSTIIVQEGKFWGCSASIPSLYLEKAQYMFCNWLLLFVDHHYYHEWCFCREQTAILLVFCVFMLGRALGKGSPRNTDEKECTHIGFSNLDGTGSHQAFADAKICKFQIFPIIFWSFLSPVNIIIHSWGFELPFWDDNY